LLPHDTFVVTNRLQKSHVMKQLPQIPERTSSWSRSGRNTAPCIVLPRSTSARTNPDAVMVVLPADHIIRDEAEFHRALNLAVDTARESSSLLTIGITPTHPETGYGYIQFVSDETSGEPVPRQGGPEVKAFAEKPNLQTAERFLASGISSGTAACLSGRGCNPPADPGLPPRPVRAAAEDRRGDRRSPLPANPRDRLRDDTRDLGRLRVMENRGASTSSRLVRVERPPGPGTKCSGSREGRPAGTRSTGKVIQKDTKNSYIYSPDKVVATVVSRPESSSTPMMPS